MPAMFYFSHFSNELCNQLATNILRMWLIVRQLQCYGGRKRRPGCDVMFHHLNERVQRRQGSQFLLYGTNHHTISGKSITNIEVLSIISLHQYFNCTNRKKIFQITSPPPDLLCNLPYYYCLIKHRTLCYTSKTPL